MLNLKARSRGLDPTQIVQYGLPIRKGFWSQKNNENSSLQPQLSFFNMLRWPGVTGQSDFNQKKSESLRSRLGVDEMLPTVLVVGGGDGMGGIVDIAKALGDKLGQSGSSPAYQLIVVCGKNEAAQKQLSNQKWAPGVKVFIKGFVNNMDEWMRASDALVTKAGPGTIAEASICGLPCMLFAYL